jgi:hypothetical protein
MIGLSLCLMTIGLSGCAGTSDGCVWVRQIHTVEGDHLTRVTEDQIIAHNMKIERFCR